MSWPQHFDDTEEDDTDATSTDNPDDHDAARSDGQDSEHPVGQDPEDSQQPLVGSPFAKRIVHANDYEEWLATASYLDEEAD
jgi:hypothetical protein